jgi:cytochrome c-type biogenesis protein CcmH/NrfG
MARARPPSQAEELMAWLIIIPMALLTLVVLWRAARPDSAALQLLATGLVFALAGYAWQGRPSLPAAAAAGVERGEQARVGGETFAALRRPILGQFDRAGSWLTMADSYLAKGDTIDAVGILQSGIRSHPKDADLWIGLGNALQLHSEGAMSAAAELAFQRARQIAPGNPAPLFFYGQALAQANRLEEAEQAWKASLAATPPGTSWRPLIEERLALLAKVREMALARQQAAMAEAEAKEKASPAR